MKSKTLMLMTIIMGTVLLTSCGDKITGPLGNNCSGSITTAFSNELNAVTAASTAYANDQTPANCQAYKDAYLDYIEAIRDWEDCAVAGNILGQWQQSLDAAEASANSIQC